MQIVSGPVLCALLLAFLHSSFARFGDDNYWRARRKIDCQNKCPTRERVCNGIIDCEDGSDEEGCASCRGSEAFHCDNNRCVPMSARCDAYDDCWDGSDENHCDGVKPLNVDVPLPIKHIDANKSVIKDYSAEISTLDDFKLDIYAFRTIFPNDPLDAYAVIYKTMRKVAFYVHGFKTDDLNDGVAMKDAIAAGVDDIDCVLVIDWRDGAYIYHGWFNEHWPTRVADNYKKVVSQNVPVVANVLAAFVTKYIPNHVKVHFIGFSLGGQISGMAARTLKNNRIRTIDRISALDPAGPIFEYSFYGMFTVDTTNTLRVTDAEFVDVIHASRALGMIKDTGHVDIDIEEMECYGPECLHHKAVETYIASIIECPQITCPRNMWSIDGTKCQVRSVFELGSLGYLADLYTGRGRHSIQLFAYDYGNNKYPTGNCNFFMKVPLKAKERVCRKPPTVTSDCRSKPYLLECSEPCGLVRRQLLCSVNGITFNSEFGRVTPSQVSDGVKWSGDQKCDLPASCYGETGERLDFFIAYKEPNSLQYLYFSRTEGGGSARVLPGRYAIDDPRSVLGRTLLPVYEQVNPVTYIIWNDDLPFGSKSVQQLNVTGGVHTEDSTSFGHSKGVLAYSETGGFLLSHTIPRFPPDPAAGPYNYPDSGKKYAQTAVCVTSRSDPGFVKEMESLLSMMITFKPQLVPPNVLHYWPPEVQDKFRELTYPRKQNYGSPIANSLAYGKVTIHSFGRSQPDLYEDCFQKMANLYNAPVLAQTWEDKRKPLASNCDRPLTVENVKKIALYNGREWLRTNDHSKWIVTKFADVTNRPKDGSWSPVLCLGDLNRAVSTIARGGMFICFADLELPYLFYNNIRVLEYEQCPPLQQRPRQTIFRPVKEVNKVCC